VCLRAHAEALRRADANLLLDQEALAKFLVENNDLLKQLDQRAAGGRTFFPLLLPFFFAHAKCAHRQARAYHFFLCSGFRYHSPSPSVLNCENDLCLQRKAG
jgi:hypothetical protein